MSTIGDLHASSTTHNNERPAYHHQPLNYNESEIRPIKIEKGDSNAAQPVCSISHFQLLSAPPCKALSCRWGDSDRSREILINGRLLPVSDNLCNFLAQGPSLEEMQNPTTGAQRQCGTKMPARESIGL